MLNAYRKSQELQLNWIRNHPVAWVTSNVALAAIGIGFVELRSRRQMRELETEPTPQA